MLSQHVLHPMIGRHYYAIERVGGQRHARSARPLVTCFVWEPLYPVQFFIPFIHTLTLIVLFQRTGIRIAWCWSLRDRAAYGVGGTTGVGYCRTSTKSMNG